MKNDMPFGGTGFAIDLHMHSTVSDGTDTPAELVERVRRAGLSVFSITDHDAVKAADMLRGALKEEDPAFIPGVEFSCRDGEGKYHILGYGFDPGSESIRAVVKRGHRLRMEKVTARLDFLKDRFGFTFPPEERKALLAMDNPGKPHLGNLMVKHGYAESKEQAIRQYIDRLRFPDRFILPEEAIGGILGAGGLPVLAHPSFGSGSQRITGPDMDRRVRRLMDCGLRGLEAFYSGFTPELHAEVLALAERYGLYVTAGSDYHGGNKSVRLGDVGPGEASELPEGLARFLKDAVSENRPR